MSPFQQQIEEHFQATEGDGALKTIRQKAWDQFQSLGLPEKKQEVWRSIKLRKLYEKTLVPSNAAPLAKESIAEHVLPGFEKRCLVFSNGRFQSALSSIEDLGDRLVVSQLAQATKSYGGFLNHSWGQAIKEESDPFAVLNSALGIEGVFIYLPPNAVIEKPVQILTILDSESPMMTQPRIHLFAGKQSEMKVVSTPVILNGGHVNHPSFECSVEENAKVSLYQLNHQLPEGYWQLETVRASLKRDSQFNAVHVTNGSETVRCDYKAALKGENSEANLSGLCMLKGKRESHTNILIDHQAPHCRSNQLFKSVLDDVSRSSFEGKIYVHQAAQKTDAFQLNNNLLLSETANAFSKPNLEIFADDVKASHGATIGQLDKEQLFYLKTRGYSQKQAERLLVKGFYLEIIDLIEDETAKDSVLQTMTKGW